MILSAESPPPGHHYRPAKTNSPTVEVVARPDGSLAVTKSYAHCSLLYRQTVGSFAIGRESWALNLLEGSGHAPRLLRRDSPYSVTMEHIAGIRLEDLDPQSTDPEPILKQAHSLLSTFKAAGLVHGDLGHDYWGTWGRESNVIWSTDQRLVAIDFSSSFPTSHGRGPWSKLSSALEIHDHLLIPKLIHRFGRAAELGDLRALSLSEIPLPVWDLWHLLGKL